MKRYRIFVMLLMVMLFALPAAGAAQCSCAQPDPVQKGAGEATCLEPGYVLMQCRTCAAEWTVTNAAQPAKGHQWTLSDTQAAGCTAAGYEEYTCSGCSASKRSTIMPMGHIWKLDERQDPGCVADGYTEYGCENCAAKKMETMPSLGGHTWKYESEKQPTCKLDGYTAYTCEVCDKTRRDLIPATGEHTWRLSFIEPAGCETSGYEEYDCAVCMTKKKTPLPAAGHTWAKVLETEGTCIELGTVTEKCASCAKEKITQTTKGDHSYSESARVEPTCVKEGAIEYTCAYCYGTRTETIDAPGHDWDDAKILKRPSCTEEGLAENQCKVCGETQERVLGMTSHEYGDWKTLKKASRKGNGKRERVCAVCGGKEVQEYTLEQARLEKEAQESKATPTPKPQATKAPEQIKETAAPAAEGSGVIEITSTAAKVNLRSGPGKRNDIAGQVAKKNTSLGTLIEAQTDKDGAVWYHVVYKKKDAWISAKYAKAVFGGLNSKEQRLPAEDITDLKDYFFCDLAVSAARMNLIVQDGKADNGVIAMRGEKVVERMELKGEGHTLHGVAVGQTFREAKELLEDQGMVCISGTKDTYIFNRPCAANAIYVTKEGFDSTVELQLDKDGLVGAIVWERIVE